MKKAIIFLFLIMFISCSKKPENGIYVNSRSPISFVELKSGQFYVSEYGNAFVGKYEVEKNTITFIYSNGRAERAIFNDSLIYDETRNQKWLLWKDGVDKTAYENYLKELIGSRDKILSNLSDIAMEVGHYHRKPVPLGGGGGSFEKWVLPDWLKNKYKDIELTGSVINQNTVSVVAIGKQKGYDNINPIRIRCNITPNGFNTMNEN